MKLNRHLILSVVTATAFSTGLSASTPSLSPSLANTRINGVMMYDNDKSVENTGIYSYSVTSPIARKPLAIIDRIHVSGDAVVSDGRLYSFTASISYGYVSSSDYYVYDVETGQQLSRTSMGYDLETVYGHVATSSSTDPTTGKVYVSGYKYNTEDKKLYPELKIWDLAGNTKTTVGSLPGSLIAMAFDAKGQLYGITGSPSEVVTGCGTLVKIDKTNGNCTEVGATGVTPKYDQSAVIDPATGVMYWFSNDANEKAILYTVDLTTGKTTQIGELPNGDEVVAAWIPAQVTPDGAPSPAKGLTPSFEGRSLKGKLIFTTPSEDFSGKTLTGKIKWTVKNGETVCATGEASVSSKVEADLEVASPGMTTFSVVLENEAGASPVEETTLYVGPDVPEAVGSLTLSRTGSTNNLSWTAPAKGLYNAYLVPDELTYRVVRLPEGLVVAESLKTTSFSEEFAPEQLQSVSYAVTPLNYGVEGAVATSNSAQAGSAIVPPFEDNLADASSFDLYTVIDANNDKKTWAYYNKTIRYTANVSAPADDWLIFPPMKLEAGSSYEVSFEAYGANARYTNSLDVHLGTQADPLSMGQSLKTLTYNNTVTAPETSKIILYPEKSGIYNIGLHVTSTSAQSYLYIRNINVSAPRSTNVPARITDLAVVPAEKGALSATVKFTAPTKTAGGADLTDLTSIVVKRGEETVKILTGAEITKDMLSVTDNTVPVSGTYTYSVLASNKAGDGEESFESAFIGMDDPLAPTDVKIIDNFNGTATVKWTPSAQSGVNGGYVDQENVLYTLKSNKSTALGSDVKGSSVEIPFDITSDTQSEFFVKISAYNPGSKVSSATVNSDTILAGRPYTVPYIESFANSQYQTSPWIKEVLAGKSYNSSWSLRSEADQDENGAGADLDAQAAGATSRLAGPKIDVSNSGTPTLTLWVRIPYDNVKFALQIKKGNDEWTTLKELTEALEWTKLTVDLTPFKAQPVRLGLYGEASKAAFLYVDNIRIDDLSGVSTIDDDSALVNVTPTEGGISVQATAPTTVSVFTTSGVCVANSTMTKATIQVSPGLYVVRVAGKSFKVAVK